MELPLYQIDAFSNRVFGGNPAAICPLESWLPNDTLQSIAAENNLSETAYFVREGSDFRLRWFTPAVEVDLCGHATLAAAYVLFTYLDHKSDTVRFLTRSGVLCVRRNGDLLEMDFPSRAPDPVAGIDVSLLAGLRAQPEAVLAARDYLCVFKSVDEILQIQPDFETLKRADKFGVIVTAPGNDCDFVSRFFAPDKGVNEDPVTGSAHCTLVPYWSKRLGKTRLVARQVSARGGTLFCEDRGERVSIAGNAAPFLIGKITL